MKTYTIEDYLNAMNRFVDVVAKKYGEGVKAVYVGGSVARGDFVPGRSDIDFYIVSKGDNKEELQKSLEGEARKLEIRYFRDLRHLHGEVVGVTVTTLTEIQKGTSFLGTGFEYQNFIKTGKLLWGDDVKAFIPKPTLKEQREDARNFLKGVYQSVQTWEKTFKWFKWIPLKLIPKRNKERWTRQAFSLIFRSASVMLCGDQVYVSGKEEIATAFKKKYPKEELCNIISQALMLWKRWKTMSLSDKETKQLLENSLKFVKGLQSLKALNRYQSNA